MLFHLFPVVLRGGLLTGQNAGLADQRPEAGPYGCPVRLRWSEKEVRDIAAMVDGEFFCSADATEAAFKRSAPRAGILHIATHAVVDEENPMFSRLLFAPDPFSEEDGCLNTYELYNMNLNAGLVVLSACNTGCGKMVNGEGIMNLARGFVYAGCPNVVVSLWSVDDRSTSQLMKNFYGGLIDGKPRDLALRDAKLECIQGTGNPHADPFYWAGMVSMGNTDPVLFRKKQEKPDGFVMPLSAAFMVFIVFFGMHVGKNESVRRHASFLRKFRPGGARTGTNDKSK